MSYADTRQPTLTRTQFINARSASTWLRKSRAIGGGIRDNTKTVSRHSSTFSYADL